MQHDGEKRKSRGLAQKAGIRLSLMFAIGLSVLLLIFGLAARADAATVVIVPDADPPGLTGNANVNWVATPSISQYSILSRTSHSDSQFICALDGTFGSRYGMSDVTDVGQGATKIELSVTARMRRSSIFTTPDDQIVLGGYLHGATGLGTWSYQQPGWSDTLGGSNCSVNFSGTNSGSQITRSVSYTPPSGTWSVADINTLEMYIGKQKVGSSDIMKAFQAYATITYDASPQIGTYQGRVFENSNTTTPGAGISPGYVYYNTPVSLTSTGQKFRLRLNAGNYATDRWGAGYGGVKLQYAKRTVATCDLQVSGWADVGPTTAGIRFYDNPNIADGAPISYQPGDALTGVGVAQSYKESNPAVTIVPTTASVSVVSWDFSLQADPYSSGESFCFKFEPISPVTSYPGATPYYVEVRTPPAPLGLDIVNATGDSVAGPSTAFGLLVTSTTCQQSTATLGTSSQKLRVVNGTATNGWSVSIAPAAGPTTSWSTADSTKKYDYNDPTSAGCTDGGDADVLAGQLSVNPSMGTVTPSSGCSLTGVTKGVNAAFSEGSVSAITLLSASPSAPLNCTWDMTGIGLTQKIPAATPVGAYSLDLVATTVAL